MRFYYVTPPHPALEFEGDVAQAVLLPHPARRLRQRAGCCSIM
jgi:hypothetical protein